MYEEFYGLKERPFQIVPNPEYLYLSSKHKNAITYLEYGLEENVGFILLTGEIGSGKTTLIRYILNRIESEIEVAVIFNTNVTSGQLLNLIVQGFDLKAKAGNKTFALEALYRFLIDKYAENKRVLLIIDEAQNLSKEVLEEVRMLSNLQTDEHLLLQIMLVGQPELKTKLKDPEFAQFTQRIAVNYHLEGLTHSETVEYIAYRLNKAEGDPDLFAADAVDLIYEASGGIPRTINLICDSALLYAFADEIETIEAEIIEHVLDELGTSEFYLPARDADISPGPIPPESIPDDLSHRLEDLETSVQKIQTQLEWQAQQLEKNGDGFKEELLGNLQDLLAQERKRSDKLLSENARLKKINRELRKLNSELLNFEPQTNNERPPSKKAANSKTNGKKSNNKKADSKGNIRALFKD